MLFQDMEIGNSDTKAGYKKIRYGCNQALADGHEFIWIDTCCIDKSNNVELSEAINSMYSWYQKAEICYAYLADVFLNTDSETLKSSFAKSRWFNRGWTLQEFIGPSDVIFFSHDWINIGAKSSLYNDLAEITGIDVNILTGAMDLESESLAKRMSWASQRDTTRVEDVAYCLMGLFDVNMPLLYGEGEKAFIRLQEEIMKHSDDQSLFAWSDPHADVESPRGLLAKSPAHFVNSSNIMPYRDSDSAPFSISNKGLRIEVHLSPYKNNLYVAALDCPAPPDYEGFLGIFLKRVSAEGHQYARVQSGALCKITARGNIEVIYVRQSVLNSRPLDIYPLHAFQLRKGPTREDGYELIETVSASSRNVPAQILSSHTKRWIPAQFPCTFKISNEKLTSQLVGALLMERLDRERLVILLGSSTDFEIGFDVASMSNVDDFEELQKSFNPKAPGIKMKLEKHQVRVNADSRIHAGAKYYMIDIVVEPIHPAPRPVDLIIPKLSSQPEERPFYAISNPSRFFRKFKARYRSSR